MFTVQTRKRWEKQKSTCKCMSKGIAMAKPLDPKRIRKIGEKERIFFLIFCFSFVFTTVIPNNCFPWWGSVHRYMSQEAAAVLPIYVEIILLDERTHRHSLMEGTIAPDNRRIADHENVSECASMIKRYAKKAEKMIRKGEDWEKVVFVLGQAAHYIQDLNQPQHCSGYETPEQHKAFESTAVYGGWKRDMCDGFHYIKKYRKFAHNTARFSVRYVRYTTKFNLLKDYEFYDKFITPLWAHAINDVADLWLTIFKNGLGEERYKELGLPQPLGIRGDRKIKYEKIKDLEKVYLSPREEKK